VVHATVIVRSVRVRREAHSTPSSTSTTRAVEPLERGEAWEFGVRADAADPHFPAAVPRLSTVATASPPWENWRMVILWRTPFPPPHRST